MQASGQDHDVTVDSRILPQRYVAEEDDGIRSAWPRTWMLPRKATMSP